MYTCALIVAVPTHVQESRICSARCALRAQIAHRESCTNARKQSRVDAVHSHVRGSLVCACGLSVHSELGKSDIHVFSTWHVGRTHSLLVGPWAASTFANVCRSAKVLFWKLAPDTTRIFQNWRQTKHEFFKIGAKRNTFFSPPNMHPCIRGSNLATDNLPGSSRSTPCLNFV